MQLQLRKFDISSISHDKVIILLGKRGTGKSVLVRDVLYNNRDIPVGSIVSPTEQSNHFYSDMVPHIFIHDELTPEIISKVIQRQLKQNKSIEKQKKVYGSSSIDSRMFLILDDCMFDSSWTHDKGIRYLFMNGRHLPLMLLITMQHPLGIPPSLRTNVDFVFILRENVVSNRKKIWVNYAGMFPTFDAFCQVMDQCTEDYECLVINNNVQSNKLEDQVFWYKADIRDNFKIGSREVWDLARRTKPAKCSWGGDDDNSDYDSEDEPAFDAKALLQGKKNTVPISVRKSIY
jgi:hypothetical protein